MGASIGKLSTTAAFSQQHDYASAASRNNSYKSKKKTNVKKNNKPKKTSTVAIVERPLNVDDYFTETITTDGANSSMSHHVRIDNVSIECAFRAALLSSTASNDFDVVRMEQAKIFGVLLSSCMQEYHSFKRSTPCASYKDLLRASCQRHMLKYEKRKQQRQSSMPNDASDANGLIRSGSIGGSGVSSFFHLSCGAAGFASIGMQIATFCAWTLSAIKNSKVNTTTDCSSGSNVFNNGAANSDTIDRQAAAEKLLSGELDCTILEFVGTLTWDEVIEIARLIEYAATLAFPNPTSDGNLVLLRDCSLSLHTWGIDNECQLRRCGSTERIEHAIYHGQLIHQRQQQQNSVTNSVNTNSNYHYFCSKSTAGSACSTTGITSDDDNSTIASTTDTNSVTGCRLDFELIEI